MRTTISIPDELFSEAKTLAGEHSFSDFAGDAIRSKVEQLRHEGLEREMELGYRAEAERPSLDLDWACTETDGL